MDQVIMDKAPPYICCFLTTLGCGRFVLKWVFWEVVYSELLQEEVKLVRKWPPFLTLVRKTFFCLYLILLRRRMLNFTGNISLFNTAFQRTCTIITSLIPVSKEKQLVLQNVFHNPPPPHFKSDSASLSEKNHKHP